jgi:integrase
MTWRRKHDGRPYADIIINGRRRRISLLTDADPDASTILTDDECQRRYDLFLKTVLPTLSTSSIPSTKSTNILSIFDQYTDAIMPARGNKPSSCVTNRRIFADFTRFLQSQSVITIRQLNDNPAVIDLYIAQSLQRHKPSTVHRDTAAVRAALNAARKRGAPVANVDWPRIKRTDPDPIDLPTPQQLRQLLDHLHTNVRTYHGRGRRNGPFSRVIPAKAGTQDLSSHSLQPTALGPSSLYNIITFIAYTGVRPSDACNLTTDRLLDLDTPEPIALITQQKTGRLIPVALSPPALEAINAALHSHPSTKSCNPIQVFLDRRGNPIHPRSITTCLAHHSRKLGLPPITAKTLRQMIVSTLYDAGVDSQMVARVTGHRSRAIESYRKIRHGAPHSLAKTYADMLQSTQVEHGSQGEDPT